MRRKGSEPVTSARLALVTLSLLAGCATTPPQPPPTDLSAICHEVFRRVDRAVAEAGVADGMAARMAGFPYLRVNRFLASYAEEELDDARFGEWVNRMRALGTEAWAVEIANLPAPRCSVTSCGSWARGLHGRAPRWWNARGAWLPPTWPTRPAARR
jgi:hypothetical protein